VKLLVDEDELAACVACGLCLPHCPTYRVTGLESASPRGRIAAMRAVHAGAPADEAFETFMDLCVQCRGCEAACPSAVPFGRLMEGARATLSDQTGYQPWWRRAPFAVLGHHRTLLALSSAGAVAQRLHLMPKKLAARLGLPRLPLRRPAPLQPSGDDVWLFTGCVMDAWQRQTHASAQRVVEATGAGVMLPGRGGDCCGALHVHAGLLDQAKKLATRVMASMPGEAPILVDSAGCGAALKDYGHLVGTPAAHAFAARVFDVQEWLAGRADLLPAPAAGRLPFRATCGTCRRPISTCGPCWRRTPTWSSWTTKASAVAPAAPTARCIPTWPATSGPGSWPPSPAAALPWWRRPTRAVRCSWPRPASTFGIPWTSSRRRSVAGEFDDIRGRLETIAEELADLAIQRLRESIDAGGTELPVDERRLTRARRAVEKAIGILKEPDDDPL